MRGLSRYSGACTGMHGSGGVVAAASTAAGLFLHALALTEKEQLRGCE